MIKFKSPLEIAKMQVANQIVAEALAEITTFVKPGIETQELDALAEEICRRRKVKPAFKNYRGYPRSICISINDEVVHGIPSHRRLSAGDLVSIDFGVRYDGYFGDAAVTLAVDEVNQTARTAYDSH